MSGRARLDDKPADRETLLSAVLAETKARDQARDESNKEFLTRLARDLAALTDAEWDKLPKSVQNWGNDAITAIKAEKWADLFIDTIRADTERRADDSRSSRDEPRPRDDDRRGGDERPRDDDRRPARDEPKGRDEPRPRDDDRRPARDEPKGREEPKARDEPKADEGRPTREPKGGLPGRPRGTGQMYDVAEVVFKFPDLGRDDSKTGDDAILDKLWEYKVRWEKGKEKAVLGNVRTAQNMVDLARKLGCWREYDAR